jgi:hypothetical protein
MPSLCLPSVLCDPSVGRIRDAVMDIYAVNVRLHAMALCTGASRLLQLWQACIAYMVQCKQCHCIITHVACGCAQGH